MNISGFTSTPFQLPSAKLAPSTHANNESNSFGTENNANASVNKTSSEDIGKSNDLSPEEQQVVKDLKERDAEVRAHEQAHAAVGGQYAGSPQYDYQTGPDGRRYAVGGQVSIDISAESDPQATIQKMQIVRRAAMAPAEPSAQDYKVAAAATQKEQQARAELNKESDFGSQSKDNDNAKTSPPGTDTSVNAAAIQAYSEVSADSLSNAISTFA